MALCWGLKDLLLLLNLLLKVQQVLFSHSVLLQVLLEACLRIYEAVAIHALAKTGLDRSIRSSCVVLQASHTWKLVGLPQVSDLWVGLVDSVLGLVLLLNAAIRG